VLLRIEGTELPGRSRDSFDGRTGILVGVQRQRRPADVLDPQPWDAEAVAWDLDCSVAAGPDGPDVRGPHVEGRPGERFVYLSWGTQEPAGFAMFRRAKLLLAEVPDATLRAAADRGRLVARLGLTDAKGSPLCAAVRPPAVHWSTA
jgi:hypothetical protein